MMLRRWSSWVAIAVLGFAGSYLARAYWTSRSAAFVRAAKKTETAPGPRGGPAAKRTLTPNPVFESPSESTEISFHVFDYYTGGPVEKVDARVRSPQGERALAIAGGGIHVEGLLPPGSRLEVRAPGYLPLFLPAGPWTVASADLFLAPAATIAVRCISEETRLPVAGAPVKLLQPSGEDRSQRADDDGMAAFEDVPLWLPPESVGSTGRYEIHVEASAENFLRKAEIIAVHRETPWNRIELLLEPALVMRGEARDAVTGKGVPGAWILHEWEYGILRRANLLAETTVADGEGRFFLQVRKGGRNLQVLVDHPSYAPVGLRLLEPVRGNSDGPDLVVQLEAGYTAEGTVTNEDGEPIPGADVDLDTPEGNEDFTGWMKTASLRHWGYVPAFAATDKEGIFRMPRVKAGTYRVHLHHDDYREDLDAASMTVGPKGDHHLGVLRKGLEIEGRVVMDDGRPVSEAMVFLIRQGPKDDVRKGYSKGAQSDIQGIFRVRGLAPGEHTVALNLDGTQATPAGTVDPANPPKPWHLVLHPRKETDTAPLGALRIFIHQEHGLSVSGKLAEVSLFRPGEKKAAAAFFETIESGDLYKENLPAGEYRLRLTVRGYAPVVVEGVRVSSDGKALADPVFVEMPPSLPVRLEVPADAQLAMAIVRCERSALVLSEVEFPQGAQEVSLFLAPGDYSACVASLGRRSDWVPFPVSARGDGTPTVVALQLP